MCLTSLKKVCRQHGILRWPYRRLKMIDRKIQSLEHHMAEGGEDQEDVRRQLEKLHNERAALPCNYGTSGLLDEAESDPSSPLSCASTTIHHHGDLFAGAGSPPSAEEEGASELELDGGCDALSLSLSLPQPHAHAHSPPAMPLRKPDPAPLSLRSSSSSAPMTAAAALISSLPAASQASPSPRTGTPLRSSAAVRKAEHQHAQQQQQQQQQQQVQAQQSERGVEADGSMRVEVSLPAELASQVAQGAQLVVHHDANGNTILEIIPVGSSSSSPPHAGLTVSLPHGLAGPAGVQAAEEQAQQQGEEGSDEDMIAALVGCAAEKAGLGLESGERREEEEELSDEALALALAGCVRADAEGGQGEAHHDAEEFEGCGELGEGAEWYHEEEEHAHAQCHHGDLDMSLFEQDA